MFFFFCFFLIFSSHFARENIVSNNPTYWYVSDTIFKFYLSLFTHLSIFPYSPIYLSWNPMKNMEMTPTAEQRLLTAVEPFKPKSLVSLNQLAFKKNQRSPSPQIITETYTKPVVPNLGVMEYSLGRGRGEGEAWNNFKNQWFPSWGPWNSLKTEFKLYWNLYVCSPAYT